MLHCWPFWTYQRHLMPVRWACHAPAMPQDVVRSCWLSCTELVCVLPQRPHPVCPLSHVSIASVRRSVQSATRIGLFLLYIYGPIAACWVEQPMLTVDTCTPTTCRSTASDIWQALYSCSSRCPRALTTWWCGWGPIDCSSTQLRLRSSGARRLELTTGSNTTDRTGSWKWLRHASMASYIDSDTSLKTPICRVVSSCFAVLRQLRSICRSVR